MDTTTDNTASLWRKFPVVAATTGIGMCLLAGIWHELVMSRFYATNNHAEHEGVALIFAAYLILGALMAWLYPRLQLNVRFPALLFGMIAGVLWVFPHELAMAGAHGKSLAYVFQNGAWHIIEQGFGGYILGKFYPMQAATPAQSN